MHPSPLHFNSKRNIPVWSARFSPLHQLIPHSIYSRFLLHTPPSITLYYKLNHPSLPHSAHGSGELCPRPHVICARRPRPSSAPRAFAPATSSARAAAALRAGRAPVPSATRPRSGRRCRPCPPRRGLARAGGAAPVLRVVAVLRARGAAPPLCVVAVLRAGRAPLPSALRPRSGRRRLPCLPHRGLARDGATAPALRVVAVLRARLRRPSSGRSPPPRVVAAAEKPDGTETDVAQISAPPRPRRPPPASLHRRSSLSSLSEHASGSAQLTGPTRTGVEGMFLSPQRWSCGGSPPRWRCRWSCGVHSFSTLWTTPNV